MIFYDYAEADSYLIDMLGNDQNKYKIITLEEYLEIYGEGKWYAGYEACSEL